MDFTTTLIRCSSIHKIMADAPGTKGITPPQLARLGELQLKEASGKMTEKQTYEFEELKRKVVNPPDPELGQTAKTELIDVYLYEKFGLRALDKDKMIMYTEKGKMVEEDAITLLSIQDKVVYEKNGERVNNQFLSGEPDIWLGNSILDAEMILDVKSSWDSVTFMNNIMNPLSKTYYWQMQGYMALTGAKKAQVCYCLVDTPETLVNDEKRRLYYAMGVATDEDPVYRALAARIEYNMKFSWMDSHYRVMRFDVERDDAAINRVYERVKLCRKWLQKLDSAHENMQGKQISLKLLSSMATAT